jgi:hypothetical protein
LELPLANEKTSPEQCCEKRRATLRKQKILKDLQEAVAELILIKAGKKVARDASEFMKELRDHN